MKDKTVHCIPNEIKVKLPKYCYSYLLTRHLIIRINRGESGYYPSNMVCESKEEAEGMVNYLNNAINVTMPQRRAMENGSMWGWDVPGADPDNEINQRDTMAGMA